MPEVPVKLYIDKLLKECRNITRNLALLSGQIKEKALRAMASLPVLRFFHVLRVEMERGRIVGHQ